MDSSRCHTPVSILPDRWRPSQAGSAHAIPGDKSPSHQQTPKEVLFCETLPLQLRLSTAVLLGCPSLGTPFAQFAGARTIWPSSCQPRTMELLRGIAANVGCFAVATTRAKARLPLATIFL